MFSVILFVFLGSQLCSCQLRGPPLVETKPILLDSFVPASMQIIAHITELMKYDLKPTPGSGTTTTTTTVAPTRPHRPAVFAPDLPPGPAAYFSKAVTYQEYVERLKYPTAGYNYFDRYRYPFDEEDERGRSLRASFWSNVYGEVPQDLEAAVGKAPSDLLKLASTVEEDFGPEDVDDQVQRFSQIYDDSDFRLLLLRQKRKPPTRAYVSLLSLYDLLNKESKKLGLNKYTGYSESVLIQLAETSTGTSADQLKTVLANINKRRDTTNQQIVKRIDGVVKDLEDSNSYINDALRYIPPLKFVL